ncbi:hypothetical protein AC625_06000 [Peribacillus loiseleuriae]|uniref:Uncharacterized protein n=1 Tax=Peribacillus loiseleuriae TaxID=1679170 RepID=A0A0K9GR43_9BACI|nr:hypothetical protein AC625_06000 [Peribacillus loiseleuriae]
MSIAKHFPILFIQRITYLDAGRPLEFIRLKENDISFIKANQQRVFFPSLLLVRLIFALFP